MTEKIKGNVLLLGNSGVGKSTLINAILGEEAAKTGWGTKGTTTELQIYENDVIPFRLIDSVGFEPSFLKAQKAIHSVQEWTRKSARNSQTDNAISVIWFCVDGMAAKLFSDTIKNLTHAIGIWKSVPIITVITKSYSELQRADNIEMVRKAFSGNKYEKNLKAILPVVAQQLAINDTSYVPSEGVTELIDKTNELLPSGIQAAQDDLASYKLNRKRFFAQGVTAAATAAAVAECAIPLPLADGLMLQPTELAEVNALARIYDIEKGEKGKTLTNSIVEVGTVGVVAKGIIAALKMIPGVNLSATVLNSFVGGSIVAALGEGSAYVFEQIYLGNKTIDDVDWVKKIMENKFAATVASKINEALKEMGDHPDGKKIVKILLETVKDLFK